MNPEARLDGGAACNSHLFKRAISTRKADEPTSSARHFHFALVHGIHDDLRSALLVDQKDTKRGRADSTDSTCIAGGLVEEVFKKTVTQSSYVWLELGGKMRMTLPFHVPPLRVRWDS
jgi:hypothetical protein